jgi:site-specific DNA-cytosine methylase
VVRENVPAPDVVDFAACLETLGYRVVAFTLDARDFTGQSRRRQILVGSFGERATRFKRALLDRADGRRISPTRPEETTAIAACVTAHPSRMAAEDSYCWESAEPVVDREVCQCLTRNQGIKGDGCRGENMLYAGGRLRILTPEEREGLQGFPRGWTAGFSRSRRAAMLGNAIPIPFAEFIGRLIKEVAGG